MDSYEYRVVPFIGQVRSGAFSRENAQTVASQLETLIKSNATGGWEFYRIDQVQILISPGCLMALFGRKQEVVQFDQVIFRHPTAA